MITHERFDLTGENKDSTFQERQIFEGNQNDPRDFNHVDLRKIRFSDATKLSEFLEKEHGQDMSWFKGAIEGKHDLWERMLAIDKKWLMKKWR